MMREESGRGRAAGRPRYVLAVAAAAALAAGIVGCSDDDSSSGTAASTGGGGAETPTSTLPTPPLAEGVALDDAQFHRASEIFFKQCAGCHGSLRAGATGPPLDPGTMRRRGSVAIEAVVQNGLPGGMPPWGKAGFLSKDEVAMMARFLQMDPPEPPQLPLEEIETTWDLKVPVKERPTKPETTRDWTNYTGVILRDAGKVGIFDSDTKERVALLNTGYAVHILRSSATGRYFYAIGRDGKITLIDLWYKTPKVVAEVKGCIDARSVEGSKFKGFEDKWIIEGCYWPMQYVIYDGLTLKPQKVVPVPTESIDGQKLKEVRIAVIAPSHAAPVWAVALKESGYVAIVDYSKPGFPISKMIAAQRFLHDGGFDHTGRYLAIAANMQNQIAVIDVKDQKRVALIDTGTKPHPGRGANWKDPKYGWVMATTHMGEGKLTIYGADPANHPEYAWKVVRKVKLPSAGTLFLKTHPKSPWVWTDATLATSEKESRRICVYSKAAGKLHKCWTATKAGRGVHFEYNKQGTEVWVSNWTRRGELIIYNDRTLKEIKRITGPWLVTPTGKFNVYNTAHDIY